MANASSWVLQYVLIVLAALLAGPWLSTLSAAQAFPLTPFGLNGSQTIRLIVTEAGLAVLCLLALRAYRELPENGRGCSFIRKLLLPITILLILLATDKTLRAAGLPLIERIGSRPYTLAYAAALVLTGLWITVVWGFNLTSLSRFFSLSAPEVDRDASARKNGTSDEASPEELAAEPDTTPTVLTGHDDPPGMLGRYKILKELGRGAMGVVYLGKDPTIQRFVAIKTMRLDETNNWEKLQETKTRFFREAESTGRLSHPNIVTIFDAGEEHTLGFIAMEMLEGTTLKSWARKPNLLPLDKLITILATVAEAMDYAHQQGVVHRDIKPANIMLTTNQVVKIMDFGIAQIASSSRTKTETVLGTPTYMSPEQIAGKKVDGRSDIFSLGVVAFELCTGHPPFTGDNVPALLYAVTHAPPPRLASIRRNLPRGLQEILDVALQKDPVHRYRRAGEFAGDLRSCLKQLAA